MPTVGCVNMKLAINVRAFNANVIGSFEQKENLHKTSMQTNFSAQLEGSFREN